MEGEGEGWMRKIEEESGRGRGNVRTEWIE